jgi:hypothetical protein
MRLATGGSLNNCPCPEQDSALLLCLPHLSQRQDAQLQTWISRPDRCPSAISNQILPASLLPRGKWLLVLRTGSPLTPAHKHLRKHMIGNLMMETKSCRVCRTSNPITDFYCFNRDDKKYHKNTCKA